MQHKGTQTLKTPRLTLRRFREDDVTYAHNNWFCDKETTKFLTWLPHATLDVSRAYIGSCIEEYKKDDFYLWTIVPDDLGQPIGTIAVVKQLQAINSAHIGYCLGSKWWGKGYMTECLQAVIQYLFEEVGYNRIVSTHDVNNPKSGNVMKKCGMIEECTLRQATLNNQGIVDIVIYDLLREDYIKKATS